MIKWETAVVRSGEEHGYLKDGWEPFGISPHDESYYFLNTTSGHREREGRTTDYIHLRRKVVTPIKPLI